MKSPVFLTLADVLKIHQDQISIYGGLSSICDLRLLLSAVTQPEATFGESFLHENLFEMAAAYAYHIALNHPFLDGNKQPLKLHQSRGASCTAYILSSIRGLNR